MFHLNEGNRYVVGCRGNGLRKGSDGCFWPVYLYRSRSIGILFVFFLMIEWLTWQDLSRQHGAALNRTLGITARNVLLYAFLLIYVLVW